MLDPKVDFAWKDGDAGSWRIGHGVSDFLVVSGSGYSRDIGRLIFSALQNEGSDLRKQIDATRRQAAERYEAVHAGQ